MADKLKQFKEWECSCRSCQAMCRRPCYGTLEDIEKIIEAGFGDRLAIDWNCTESDENASIPILTPALKGHEGRKDPSFPASKEGCTFFKNGKCELHDLNLKPLEGKTSIHDLPNKQLMKKADKQHDMVKEHIMQSWLSEKGQKVVDKWCENHNIPNKEMELNFFEFFDGMWKNMV
jgi:hypothetical protein